MILAILSYIVAFLQFGYTLFEEKYNNRTDEDKRCRSDTEISDLTAIVPLQIALAKHCYTHQRHKDVDCLIPNIKYLQYRQYHDG